MSRSKRTLRVGSPRAKKPSRRAKRPDANPLTIGRIMDRVREVAAIPDDTAYGEQLMELAAAAGLSEISLTRLGPLASITRRVADACEAAWKGDSTAFQRLRAAVLAGDDPRDDPAGEAYASLVLGGQIHPLPMRHAVLRARAALDEAGQKDCSKRSERGVLVFRQLCRTIFSNDRDATAKIEAALRALTSDQPVEVRRVRILEAVRRRADIDEAMDLLLAADDAFYNVDEAELRAILQSGERRGDYAIAASLSLLAGACGDVKRPGEEESAARRRIARCFEVAASKLRRSAGC
jgi:hypothetical protein